MYKGIIGVLCLAICLMAAPASAQDLPGMKSKAIFTLGEYSVNVDGQDYNIDAPTFAENGRIYLPIRFLGEVLGAKTTWENGEVVLTVQDRTIALKPDTLFVNVNGKYQLMDVVPTTVPPGRVCLPARYVCEAAGFNVSWANDINAMVVTQ